MQAQQSKSAGDPQKGLLTLIKGETKSGKKFRPSDWADRLFGAVACFARDEYGNADEISHCVSVVDRGGIKGIIIDPKLHDLEPNLYNFMQNFARDNNLEIEGLSIDDWNDHRRKIINRPRRKFA